MQPEEKVIFSLFFLMFAIAGLFTKHMKGWNRGLTGLTRGRGLFPWVLLNDDGTERKYAKLIWFLFFIIWIPLIWVFG